jgi:hypothetical protein
MYAPNLDRMYAVKSQQDENALSVPKRIVLPTLNRLVDVDSTPMHELKHTGCKSHTMIQVQFFILGLSFSVDNNLQ